MSGKNILMTYKELEQKQTSRLDWLQSIEVFIIVAWFLSEKETQVKIKVFGTSQMWSCKYQKKKEKTYYDFITWEF